MKKPLSAAEVAKALGGEESWRHEGNFECPCPVPSHGKGRGDRRASLSLKDGEAGKLLVNCFAGCDPLEVLAELRRRLAGEVISGAVIGGEQNGAKPARDLRDYARQLFREAVPIQRTLAERYLREVRGISIALPPTLKAHPAVKVPGQPKGQPLKLPALIAGVSAEDHLLLGVQVLWLDKDGNKSNHPRLPSAGPRRNYGPFEMGAVRLGAAAEALGIAEGIESALSASELFGLPVWAALGAERLSRVAIPASVKRLTIYADADDAGFANADRAAHKLERSDLSVTISMPDAGDYNDQLRDKAA